MAYCLKFARQLRTWNGCKYTIISWFHENFELEIFCKFSFTSWLTLYWYDKTFLYCLVFQQMYRLKPFLSFLEVEMFLWWEEQRFTLLSDFCVCDLLILTNLSKYLTKINIQGCRLLYFLQSIISSISNWSWISKGCCWFYLFKLLNVLFNVDLHEHFAFFAGSRNWTWKNWSMSSLFLIKLFRYSSENAWYKISNELWKGYWFPCWTIYLRASFFYLNKMGLVRILSSFLTSVSLCILKNCGQIFKVDFFVFDPYWYFQF